MLRRPAKPTMAKNYPSSTLLKKKMKGTSIAVVKPRSRLTLQRIVMSLKRAP